MAGNLLKKSSGFMLLCSVSLLMIVMTGCQEAKLKTVIADSQQTVSAGHGRSRHDHQHHLRRG